MAFILLIIFVDKNINSLINKIDDVASQLILQGKNAGLSEDRLEMLLKQITRWLLNLHIQRFYNLVLMEDILTIDFPLEILTVKDLKM